MLNFSIVATNEVPPHDDGLFEGFSTDKEHSRGGHSGIRDTELSLADARVYEACGLDVDAVDHSVLGDAVVEAMLYVAHGIGQNDPELDSVKNGCRSC